VIKTYSDKHGQKFTRIYQIILADLLVAPEYKIAPRGIPIHEFVNASIEVDSDNVVINFLETGCPERQEVYDRYRREELAWYLSGSVIASSAPSKFWLKLADGEGKITSNYGHMMMHDKIYPKNKGWVGLRDMTALEKVVDTLAKDPDSRQAVVHYNQPKHCYEGNKDFPCTMYSQFFIRDNKLHISTHQRSVDVIKGLSYDICWSSHFLEIVLGELQITMPTLALGKVSMIFGSMHLYEKDIGLAMKITKDTYGPDK